MRNIQDTIREGFYDNVGVGVDPKVKSKWDKIITSKQQFTNSKGQHLIAFRDGVYDYDDLVKFYNENAVKCQDINAPKKASWQKPFISFILKKEFRVKETTLDSPLWEREGKLIFDPLFVLPDGWNLWDLRNLLK